MRTNALMRRNAPLTRQSRQTEEMMQRKLMRQHLSPLGWRNRSAQYTSAMIQTNAPQCASNEAPYSVWPIGPGFNQRASWNGEIVCPEASSMPGSQPWGRRGRVWQFVGYLPTARAPFRFSKPRVDTLTLPLCTRRSSNLHRFTRVTAFTLGADWAQVGSEKAWLA